MNYFLKILKIKKKRKERTEGMRSRTSLRTLQSRSWVMQRMTAMQASPSDICVTKPCSDELKSSPLR